MGGIVCPVGRPGPSDAPPWLYSSHACAGPGGGDRRGRRISAIGAQPASLLLPADFYKLRSVGDVQLSPTAADLAYSVISNSRPGRPTSSTWLRDMGTGETVELENGSGPRWSPDGRWIAYLGRTEEGAGLIVATRRGEAPRLIAPVDSTNHPLPSSGQSLAWAPDGRAIAFVSATPGPESEHADGDPMVITRYLYKPTAAEGLTRFNDNKRLHVFVVDVATRSVRQLTNGPYYEHSIDWSPKGDQILFVSNRETSPDKTFNYDIFTFNVRTGATQRLTTTKSAEYYPAFSPDGSRIAFAGTTRDLTSSETTMEDTHVWVMRSDGDRARRGGQVHRQSSGRAALVGRRPAGIVHRTGTRQGEADGGGRQHLRHLDDDRRQRQRRRVLGGEGSAGLRVLHAGGPGGAVRDRLAGKAEGNHHAQSSRYWKAGGWPRWRR